MLLVLGMAAANGPLSATAVPNNLIQTRSVQSRQPRHASVRSSLSDTNQQAGTPAAAGSLRQTPSKQACANAGELTAAAKPPRQGRWRRRGPVRASGNGGNGGGSGGSAEEDSSQPSGAPDPRPLDPSSGSSLAQEEACDASGRTGLLLEVEGVMVDLHRTGHLEAFNSAFLACGFDSARWTTASYSGLHRRTGGDPAAMLRVFFEQQRWPVEGMDAAAKDALVARLLRLKGAALEAAAAEGRVPLRPGLVELLEEALGAGCQLAALASQARCGEAMARQLLQRLPRHLREALLVVGEKEARESLFWQVAGERQGAPRSLDEALSAELAQAVAARKQLVAEQVARVLRVRADVDTGSLGGKGAEAVAAMRAACELRELPLSRVVVLAGSQTTVQVANRAGIPSVAVRSSISAQAEFPGALLVYEDFGPGSLTLPRLFRRLGFC